MHGSADDVRAKVSRAIYAFLEVRHTIGPSGRIVAGQTGITWQNRASGAFKSEAIQSGSDRGKIGGLVRSDKGLNPVIAPFLDAGKCRIKFLIHLRGPNHGIDAEFHIGESSFNVVSGQLSVVSRQETVNSRQSSVISLKDSLLMTDDCPLVFHFVESQKSSAVSHQFQRSSTDN
jgi:hypothetical protein